MDPKDLEVNDKLIFVEASDEQVKWGNNDDPRPLMTRGDKLTLKHKEVHTWHTKLEFVEFPGKKFNSVHFKKDNPVIHQRIF